MVFQDDLTAQLQDLINFIEFVKSWVLSTKNEDWVTVDPGYATAKEMYMKMRQLIINQSSALPTV